MQSTCHPRKQLVVNNHLQASRRQETLKLRELLSYVSFWISEPWQADGSNGILHRFCWWSRFASCLSNIASKYVCMVKVSLFELVSGVRENQQSTGCSHPLANSVIYGFLCPVLSRTSRTFVFEWKIKVLRDNSLWGTFFRTLVFSVWCLLPENKMQRLSHPIPGRSLVRIVSDSVMDISTNTNKRDRYRWFNGNQIYINFCTFHKKPKTRQQIKKKNVISILINLDY